MLEKMTENLLKFSVETEKVDSFIKITTLKRKLFINIPLEYKKYPWQIVGKCLMEKRVSFIPEFKGILIGWDIKKIMIHKEETTTTVKVELRGIYQVLFLKTGQILEGKILELRPDTSILIVKVMELLIAEIDLPNVLTDVSVGDMVYFELKSMKLKEDPVILLGAEPKDICPVCKLLFNSRQDMESHFNRFIDELSYNCDVCNMSFHGNAQLELHKQHKHSTQHNEKLPFQCDTCNEKFSQKRMLKKHLMSHNATKSFPCDICDETFNTATSRDSHLKSKHETPKETECSAEHFEKPVDVEIQDTSRKSASSTLVETENTDVSQTKIQLCTVHSDLSSSLNNSANNDHDQTANTQNKISVRKRHLINDNSSDESSDNTTNIGRKNRKKLRKMPKRKSSDFVEETDTSVEMESPMINNTTRNSDSSDFAMKQIDNPGNTTEQFINKIIEQQNIVETDSDNSHDIRNVTSGSANQGKNLVESDSYVAMMEQEPSPKTEVIDLARESLTESSDSNQEILKLFETGISNNKTMQHENLDETDSDSSTDTIEMTNANANKNRVIAVVESNSSDDSIEQEQPQSKRLKVVDVERESPIYSSGEDFKQITQNVLESSSNIVGTDSDRSTDNFEMPVTCLNQSRTFNVESDSSDFSIEQELHQSKEPNTAEIESDNNTDNVELITASMNQSRSIFVAESDSSEYSIEQEPLQSKEHNSIEAESDSSTDTPELTEDSAKQTRFIGEESYSSEESIEQEPLQTEEHSIDSVIIIEQEPLSKPEVIDLERESLTGSSDSNQHSNQATQNLLETEGEITDKSNVITKQHENIVETDSDSSIDNIDLTKASDNQSRTIDIERDSSDILIEQEQPQTKGQNEVNTGKKFQTTSVNEIIKQKIHELKRKMSQARFSDITKLMDEIEQKENIIEMQSKILEDLKFESSVIEEEILAEMEKFGENEEISLKEEKLVKLEELNKTKDDVIRELKSKATSENGNDEVNDDVEQVITSTNRKSIVNSFLDVEKLRSKVELENVLKEKQESIVNELTNNKEVHEKEVKQLREEIKLQLDELYKLRKDDTATFIEAKTRRIKLKAVSLRKQVQIKENLIKKLMENKNNMSERSNTIIQIDTATQVNLLKCGQCSKSYTQQIDFTKHMQLHKNKKLYKSLSQNKNSDNCISSDSEHISDKSISSDKNCERSKSPDLNSDRSVSPDQNSEKSILSDSSSERSISPARSDKSLLSNSSSNRSRSRHSSISRDQSSGRSLLSDSSFDRSVSPARSDKSFISNSSSDRSRLSLNSDRCVSRYQSSDRSLLSVSSFDRSVSPARSDKSLISNSSSDRSRSRHSSISRDQSSDRSLLSDSSLDRSVSPNHNSDTSILLDHNSGTSKSENQKAAGSKIPDLISDKDKPFSCEYCDKAYSRKGDLTKHLKLHTKEKRKHKEDKNQKSLGSKSPDLISDKDKPFSCEYCDKAYSRKGDLTKHLKLHTKEKRKHKEDKNQKSLGSKSPDLISDKEKPFSCEYCDKAYSRKGDLTKHLKLHTKEKRKHTEDINQKYLESKLPDLISDNEKPFSCEYCDKAYSRKGDLTKHVREHIEDKKYTCDYCDETFSREIGLTRHINICTRK